jgi:hypothetical protein
MPIPCQANSSAIARAADHPAHLALHCLGLDILGPFPRAQGGYRYLYVAIDMFTNTSQAYLYFLMLHACFTPIALCFVYTTWHFYAFLELTY